MSGLCNVLEGAVRCLLQGGKRHPGREKSTGSSSKVRALGDFKWHWTSDGIIRTSQTGRMMAMTEAIRPQEIDTITHQ